MEMWVNGSINGWMCGKVDGLVSKWMGGFADGEVIESVDEWVGAHAN